MKTNILSNMNSFAKRAMMVIAVVMMASSAWGLTSSDISSTAATTITDGGLYVVGTSSSANLLNGEWHGSNWGYCTNTVSEAIVFTAHGSTSSFYLTSSVCGTIVAATSNFPIYNNGTSENLSLGGSGQIQNKASNTYILRYNNTGARWYDSSTGTVMYLYPVTLPARTVTYDAGSGTCKTSDTESSGGSGITLAAATPSAACAAEGWVFAGWKQTSAQTETTLIPTMYAAGSKYYPTANETLYAVYRLGTVYTIDFESALDSYSNWSFNQITSKQSTIHTHSGSYYGVTSGGSVTITTTEKIASPKDIQFYVTRTNGNTTESTWEVKTSSDGSNWNSITFQSAVSMNSPTWLKISQDLSSYSNVYVRISYGTSTSVRAIDDVTLSCATYNSNPSCCDKIVELSKGTQTNATISSFSPSSVPTCSNTAADRNVTITVAAATGYEFTSSARLSYSGNGTATYVSGPTGTGPYTFVYQFTKDDNGDGTFSVTSATPKTYTITYLDQGGGAFTGTQAGAPTTHTYGTATTLKIPTKFGHTFGGWYTASDCASGAVGDASSASLAADGYTDDITLYAKWTEKAVTNYRTSCCDYKVTFTQNDPENGTIAFSHSSLTTCGATDGERQRTMTITPDPGYKLKTFEVADGDGKVAASNTSPAVAVDEDNSDAQVITLTFAQNAEGNYDVTATFEEMHDEYYDYMHANAKQGANRTGVYNAPSLSSKTATTGADCKENHYKFKGWVAENEINENGTLKGGYTLISGGTSMTASNKKYYAVWAEEE